MAIGVLFELPDVTQAQYDEIADRMTGGRGLSSLSGWPVEGILMHAAGPTETGFRVVDVWESEEAFQRFGETLMPLAAEAGLTDLEPQIFQLHNLVTS